MSKPNEQSTTDKNKVVMVMKETEQGTPRIAAIASGSEGEALLRQAENTGTEVVENEEMLNGLLPPPVEGETIPIEIYELIACLINFTQELNEGEWDESP